MCALCSPRFRQGKCALQILNKDANTSGNEIQVQKNTSRNMNAKLCMCAGQG